MGPWLAWKRPEGIERGGEEAGPCASCLKTKKYGDL